MPAVDMVTNNRDSARYPTGDDLRTALSCRVSRFAELTGLSLTAIGEMAVRDGRAIVRILRGDNFTVGKYDRIMTYITDHWPRRRKPPSAEQDEAA
jgi:hypothetical protein